MSTMYSLGSALTLTRHLTDSAGTPVDATAMALTVRLPDGTTSAALTVTHGTTGVYTAPYTPASAGRYVARWVATGTNAGVFEESFNVLAQWAGAGLVALADVKDHLNLDATDNDAELQAFILAATAVVEDITGPIVRATTTEYLDDIAGSKLTLTQFPVLSVTSITEYADGVAQTLTEQPIGATTDGYGFSVNTATGVVTRRDASGLPCAWGSQAVVTYVAGRLDVPPAVRNACLDLIKANWSSQTGRARARSNDADLVLRGFFMPTAVLEQLQPYHRPPGVA